MSSTSLRSHTSYENLGFRFLRHSITNGQEKENNNNSAYGQYNSLYLARLRDMRPIAMGVAKKRWGELDLQYTEKIIDCESLSGKECVLVGTLYKEMELKSSVLDDFKEMGSIDVNVKPIEKYTSPNDFFLLEDESGRVRLRGMENKVGSLVTGVLVALKGIINDSGTFDVHDWTTCGENFKYNHNAAPPTNSLDSKIEPTYVLLTSDLNICDSASGYGLAIQMLVDFLHGNLGSLEDQRTAKRIVRIILAGNCIAAPKEQGSRKSSGKE